jgi:cytochrome c oxidase assembly factor CtaG
VLSIKFIASFCFGVGFWAYSFTLFFDTTVIRDVRAKVSFPVMTDGRTDLQAGF